MIYHLAIDLGASNVKLILGFLENGKLKLEEIYRFEHRLIQKNGSLCWDVAGIFSGLKKGIQKSMVLGKTPATLAVDSWGVDFVLLDHEDKVLGEIVSYRDDRTKGIMEMVLTKVSKEEIYQKTGIQFQPFNTLFQLIAIQKYHPEILAQAKSFLMLPDYIHFLLTGRKTNEYTNATTTQLVNAKSRTWDWDLIRRLNLPEAIFLPLKHPGEVLGSIRDSLAEELGAPIQVIIPATHDTASAFMTLRSPRTSIILSSGTWSLVGIEILAPDFSQSAFVNNFSNEGGYGGTYRFLKNIAGLWIIQEVKRLLGDQYTFEQLADLAKLSSSFPSLIDVDHPRFINPGDMIQEIKLFCQDTNQLVPDTIGEIAFTVYHSLSRCISEAIDEIQARNGHKYTTLQIVGGGSRNLFLNELIAKQTNLLIICGPIEATSVGNILGQLIGSGEIPSWEEGRKLL